MNDEKLLQELKEQAKSIIPKGGKIWLYGSRARGDEHVGSDWDLLILINKASIQPTDFDSLCYPFVKLGWQYKADISPQLYTLEEWDNMHITPYYQNIEHDKQVIYES